MQERPGFYADPSPYRTGAGGGTPRKVAPKAVKPPVCPAFSLWNGSYCASFAHTPSPVVTSTGPLLAKKPVVTGAPTPSPRVVVTGSSQTDLQAAVALLNSNPCGLSQTQWTLLQNNGYVASTLPFSSACLISPSQQAAANDALTSGDDPQCVAAGMTGGPYPNCTAAPVASSLLAGVDFTDPTTWPWWMWGGIAGGGYYFVFRKKGRGRR